MYQFSVDEATTNKVKQVTRDSRNLLDKFSEIDKKYEPNPSPTLEVEKLEYERPSLEDINKKAEDSLIDYKKTSIDGINSKYDQKKTSLESQITDTQNSVNDQKAQVEASYSKVKTDAENDAVKRGLARSSIIVNKLSSFDQSMLNELAELSNVASEKIDSLKTEMSGIVSERDSALNSFNIEYAIKLQDKIDELNAQVAKEEKEVIKYNNEMAELKAKWEQEAYDNALKYYEYLNESGTYVIDNIKYNEKYELAKEHFMSMPQEQALAELEGNPIYQRNIGDANFKKLIKEIKDE